MENKLMYSYNDVKRALINALDGCNNIDTEAILKNTLDWLNNPEPWHYREPGRIVEDGWTAAEYIEYLSDKSGAHCYPDNCDIDLSNFDEFKAEAGYPDLWDYPLSEADFFITEVGGRAVTVKIFDVFEGDITRICELPD